jgi:hypothetical protein
LSITGWNASAARALNPSSKGKSSVIRPWQPAIPQAMQRHGGQTRPAGPPSAKAGAPPRRDAVREDRDASADAATARDETAKTEK